MKKIFYASFLWLLAIALIYDVSKSNFAYAVVSGTCSTCHYFEGTNLKTRYDCISCHNGSTPVATAPNVAADFFNMTAGGTFNSSAANNGNKLHNVSVMTGLPPELFFSNTVPGKPAGQSFGPTGANDLTCAGSTGCHGDRTKVGNDAGMSGFHHGSAAISKGAYRFLVTYDGVTQTPVMGKGSSTWEKSGPTATDHNVYYSAVNPTDKASMDAFCASCHGNFHGASNTTSGALFVRHPVANIIPADWNTVGGGVVVNYSANPFAFSGGDFTAITTGTPYTMGNNPKISCISCHRAHGSNQPDLLRFDYAAQVATSGVSFGCLGCHTYQRTP